MVFSFYKYNKAVLPVFIIITGLSVLFCGCDLTISSVIDPIEDYNRWYIREHNNYSEAEWQECLAVLDQLSVLGITRPERFLTLQDAKYIVEQRIRLANKTISADRPVTITMYPFYDYGGNPLSGKNNDLSAIINRPDQQMLYFEINNDADLKAALTLLKNNLPDGKKIVIILAGHGDSDFLCWNTGPAFFQLDPTDYEDPEFINLFRSLPIELVIFDSCTAGEGGADKQNQANRLAQHIRIGGTVIAPLTMVYGITCLFDSGNNISDIRYNAWTSDYADIAYYAAGKYDPRK